MKDSPKAVAGGAAAALVVLLVVLWSQFSSAGVSSQAVGSLFFTIDDGKTTFVDSAGRSTPFQVDGKTAVQAVMFNCPGTPKPFVGYLRRGSAVAADPKLANVPVAQQPTFEIKRPGEAKWASVRSREAGQIRQSVRCPDGKHEPREVSPD